MAEEAVIKRLVVIGGSAGSLQALLRILGLLRAEFPFPILLVLHRQSGHDSTLQDLLTGKSALRVREVEEKDRIETGFVYTCPADYHVLIEKDGTFSLDVSEKVNYSRPSLDVVFRSAADVYGKRLIAIILSGANSDGADGLHDVAAAGGLTIVQDPADAIVPYMPEQAIKRVKPDHVLPAAEIGELLNQLAR